MKIGITERGDAGLDHNWKEWVNQGKPAILITKNIEKLYNVLITLIKPNIIVHCNITGLGGTKYEPNVPKSEESITFLKEIVNIIGKDRVVLRIDPIFLEKDLAELALNVKKTVDREINGLRTRISFVDNYKHVQKRFEKIGLKKIDYDFHGEFEKRKKLWEIFGKPDTCGEPGLPSVGCISEIDCHILGIKPNITKSGQRKECTCLSNKKELLSNKRQCGSKCAYCYWIGDCKF